jgi:hypothetical protein
MSYNHACMLFLQEKSLRNVKKIDFFTKKLALKLILFIIIIDYRLLDLGYAGRSVCSIIME